MLQSRASTNVIIATTLTTEVCRLVSFLLDPYKRIERIVINYGRPYVQMSWSAIKANPADPQLLFVSGIAFEYNFETIPAENGVHGSANVSFGIISGGAAISVATDLPGGEEEKTDSILLLLQLYTDPTPGALEAALAASGGVGPADGGGYPQSFAMEIFAQNTRPENAYNGVIWTLSDEGMTGQIIFGDNRSSDVFQTYAPPVPPIPV